MKCGRDVILVKLLKHAKDDLTVPITDIINYYLTIGIFLNSLKIAEIVPIFKKSSPTDPSDYHQFRFFRNQFGFQRGKCTVDALLQLSKYLYQSLNSSEP